MWFMQARGVATPILLEQSRQLVSQCQAVGPYLKGRVGLTAVSPVVVVVSS
jgi:hypothetical protein